MKLLSRVCAEFTDGKGKVIYRIRPNDRLVYKDDAPEAIRGDLLFRMLVADGSIKVPETAAQKKVLEQDPMVGVTAEGKSETGKPAKTGKTARKETKADDKPGEPEPGGTEQKE